MYLLIQNCENFDLVFVTKPPCYIQSVADEIHVSIPVKKKKEKVLCGRHGRAQTRLRGAGAVSRMSMGGRRIDDHNAAVTLASALRDVFGDSDSDSDSSFHTQVGSKEKQVIETVWEQVKEINGLWLCKNFLSPQQQEELLHCIQQERWFEEPPKNQAMRFGDLPEWALKLCGQVQFAICSYPAVCKICNISTSCSHEDEKCMPLSLELLGREPLFDQMIVNVYQPAEGICAHVDLARFEDGIAIISLESACVMEFTHENDRTLALNKFPILLVEGDLLLLSGEARYNWLHEINRNPGHQIWD
ncbi:hypothetical protein KI387_029869, partial [Taxus chinensis]